MKNFKRFLSLTLAALAASCVDSIDSVDKALLRGQVATTTEMKAAGSCLCGSCVSTPCASPADDFPFTGGSDNGGFDGSYCNNQCQWEGKSSVNPPPPLALFIIAMNCTLIDATDPNVGRTCDEDVTYTGALTIRHTRGDCPDWQVPRGADLAGISYPNVYKIQRPPSCTTNSRLQPKFTITRTDQGSIPATEVRTSCSRALYIDMIVPSSPNTESPVPCPVNTDPIPGDCGGVAYAYKIVGFVNDEKVENCMIGE